jgi:hypothetical protein
MTAADCAFISSFPERNVDGWYGGINLEATGKISSVVEFLVR